MNLGYLIFRVSVFLVKVFVFPLPFCPFFFELFLSTLLSPKRNSSRLGEHSLLFIRALFFFRARAFARVRVVVYVVVGVGVVGDALLKQRSGECTPRRVETRSDLDSYRRYRDTSRLFEYSSRL